MKILVIAGYFPKSATPTAGIWALELTRALQRSGQEVVVLSPTPRVPPWLALTNKMVRYAQIPPSTEIDGIRVHYPRCFYYPSRLVKRLIYAHLPQIELLPSWLGVKRLAIRLQNHHHFDIVHCHHPLMEGEIGRRIKAATGLPLMVTEWSIADVKTAKRNRLRKNAYGRVIRHADGVMAPSQRVVNEMAPVLEGKSVDIIPTGVHLSSARSVRALRPGRLRNNKVVLSVGALSERKGHKFLIEAIHQLRPEVPDLKCLIIGAGPQRGPLEDLIDRLGLAGHVEMLGQRSHLEVLEHMSWCDVFALPSWDEPFATVYPEAMSFGKPIIACSGEGTDDLLRNGENAMLVERQDAAALARALKRLLTIPGLARRMGEKGKKLTQRRLTWEANAARMIGIFEEVLYSARYGGAGCH